MKPYIACMCTGLVLVLVGCETIPTTPQPASTTRVDYTLPVLSPVEPQKQTQEQDGIRISVAPYDFGVRKVVEREYRRKQSLFIVNDQYPVDIRTTTRVQVHPNRVAFKIKINNQLERVLRLAGTVVVFQVDGKQAAVDQASYQKFLNGIILPRQEGEYDIGGPALSDVPDNATVALLLYDIVTQTDAAGNPTKRSNFEFFYTLSRQRRSENVPADIKSGSVNTRQAEILMRREREQGRRAGDWIKAPDLGPTVTRGY